MQSLNINENDLHIKITDKDLLDFWQTVNPTYELGFNIENQAISDESILALADLVSHDICRFTRLRLAGNDKITQVSILKLGQALRNKTFIKEINLNNLQIGSNGIKY